MQSKSLLIAIAAFAVATTGVSAYGGAKTAGRNGGLEKEKTEAIEEARESCRDNDRRGARDVLLSSGTSKDGLKLLYREHKNQQRAIHKAIEENDYTAFKKAIAGLPLADIVTTKADFEQFRSAHQYKKELDKKKHLREGKSNGCSNSDDLLRSWFGDDYFMPLFSQEQKQALEAARKTNNRSMIQAIYDEAGYEHWHKKRAGITGKHR